jgi:phosphoribosylanthranilate isomerase
MRTRIKICGITRPGDALAAAEAGADAVGLVFYPQSPRYLAAERAVGIRDALPPFVQTVALFVNPDAAQVAQVIGRVRPGLLQFHGDETPAFCAQFGMPYIKAYRVKSGVRSEVDLLEYLRPFSGAAAWLLDSHVEEYGGVGESFDWSRARRGGARPAGARATSHLVRRAQARQCRRGDPPGAPLGRRRLERGRVREGHQGRRENRRVHRGGQECGCMTYPTRRGISALTAACSSPRP